MARVKRGVMRHKRHKKLLKKAKGYFQRKRNVFKNAHEQVMKSGQYAFRDRRAKKRDFRRLWIVRLSGALSSHGVKYSQFIHALGEKGVTVNRKMLSEMAIHDPKGFESMVKSVMG
jgi:large subunit ribosomal protein L20